jgi:hypothetical protein
MNHHPDDRWAHSVSALELTAADFYCGIYSHSIELAHLTSIDYLDHIIRFLEIF